MSREIRRSMAAIAYKIGDYGLPSMVTDSFVAKVLNLIESGCMARMSGDAFKTLLVNKIQGYSHQIPMLEEDVSPLFLNLTELMITGTFAKIPPDAFKVYLILAIYGKVAGMRDQTNKLLELTGIDASIKLEKALEDLQTMGLIFSVDEPVVKRVKPDAAQHGLDFQMKPVLDKA